MPFTIPNAGDAGFPAQAEPDKVDFDVLAAGTNGTGVLTGCAVTAQATPDMTVAVASGTVSVAGVSAAVTSGNLAISAADASNPRFDLVVVSNTGAKSVVAGAPAGAPVFPAIPASSVALAAVYVPAADTAIQSNQIVDKRVLVLPSGGAAGGAKLIISAAQSIPASGGLPAAVSWDAEEWDTDGYHDTVTNPTRITIPAGLAGKVRLEGFIWSTAAATFNSGQYCTVRIRKNGGSYLRGPYERNHTPAVLTNGSSARAVDNAAAGDYYELVVTQADTSSRALDAALCAFTIERLGS